MTEQEMEALVTRLENKLRTGWRAMVRGIKDENALASLEAKIARNDVGALIDGIETAVKQFTADLADGYTFAARRAARSVDAAFARAFRFDVADPDVTRWMRETAGKIARPLVEEQQAVARRVYQHGRQRGWTARKIAEEVQGSVGLNATQVDQVFRYRDMLEAGDYRRAMSYELADGRYDAALRRARDNGTFFGRERIDAMVSRYRDNWVRFRSDVIALSEAANASHAGINEAINQAIDARFLNEDDVTKTWVTRGDHRVRHSHRYMNGQRRRINEHYVSGNGNRLLYPGDSSAPAKETANCRCVSVIRLRDGTTLRTRFGQTVVQAPDPE
jgi:hypothetical protein